MSKIWKAYKEEYRSLFQLGLPVLVTQLGIIVVGFADTMMVGAYGVDELAAAAFVNSLFVIPIVMQIGFASGLTPLVGALFGQGNSRDAGRTLRAGVQINLAVSLAMTAFMGILYFFLDRFGQPEELMPLVRTYYLIVLSSMIPLAVFNTFQQMSNAINDTQMPMWMILGSNLINIFGNWVLIFGHLGAPELGLAGAGVSTMVARWASMAGMVFVFLHYKRYRPYTYGYHERGGDDEMRRLRREVWTTSYPVMIQSGIECSLWSFGAVVSGWFGKIQLAAYQVVNTMAQLGFMTFISFGTAVSIRVANYIGVEDIRGARRITSAGLHLNIVLATVASLIFLLGGKWILGCFTQDADVIASAGMLIAPLVIYQYMDAIQLTYCNAIRGTSEVKPLLWISLSSYIIIGIPVLLWFAKGLDSGNIGVYYSFDVALFAASLIATLTFYHIIRKFTRTQNG